jgi:hypothetical protein
VHEILRSCPACRVPQLTSCPRKGRNPNSTVPRSGSDCMGRIQRRRSDPRLQAFARRDPGRGVSRPVRKPAGRSGDRRRALWPSLAGGRGTPRLDPHRLRLVLRTFLPIDQSRTGDARLPARWSGGAIAQRGQRGSGLVCQPHSRRARSHAVRHRFAPAPFHHDLAACCSRSSRAARATSGVRSMFTIARVGSSRHATRFG